MAAKMMTGVPPVELPEISLKPTPLVTGTGEQPIQCRPVKRWFMNIQRFGPALRSLLTGAGSAAFVARPSFR